MVALEYDTAPVCDVPVALCDRARFIVFLTKIVASNNAVSVRLVNAYSIASAIKDRRYREVLCGPGINLSDGHPVVWSMKLRGYNASLVRGPDLFSDCLSLGTAAGLKHFLLGATPETLSRLQVVAQQRSPGIEIAGAYAPPFGPVENFPYRECVRQIAESGANIVWVAMGTPKQDVVSQALSEQSGVTCIGVGAAFDFLAGTVSEAPRFVQSIGLEWLYRLCCEPKRLWRRYTFDSLRFIARASRDFLPTQKS